ncbi:hypothetical protein [Methylobacterium sp. PvR107]|uniref:hypothetical protein n=1 Tax=Methylobacterium sp. PvR107 TaxID=2806597 RepID=UPI001B6EBC37|nr:hypothetical protein [Methylobacterium sp. PvR107]MBP1183964.1 sugar lactone lactonase YvrE [Methylobacterium sp. PvR107]
MRARIRCRVERAASALNTPRQGRLAEPDPGHHNVYRFDPASAALTCVAARGQPKGLAFAPDGRTLDVTDTAHTAGGDGHRI